MILGYPDTPCVTAGGTLALHVSSDAPALSVRFLRWGARVVQQPYSSAGIHAEPALPGHAGTPWDWPSYAFAIGSDWRPGVYAAALLRDGSRDVPFDAREGRALFVVRAPRPTAPLLVVLPLFTYQAYNVGHVDGTLRIDEGECLYSGSRWVTLHRPGGGNGGHPWDEVNADAYDRESPRQTFVHWDGKALAWLERSGFRYDCCTDLDLHEGIELQRYRAVASFGHHEYWSDAMRDRVQRYVAEGGNAAFFGGNTCWFRIEYDAAHNAIRRIGRWSENPEWRFTGVSYAYGAGKWIGERPPAGFAVTEPGHWIFSGTELRAGDVFGAEQRLIGYECDGAPAESDARILASSPLSHWRVSDGSGEVSRQARADLTLREAGGMVFSASTVDWARALENEKHVARITRNVLERFTAA